MRVLITGHDGYIGSVLSAALTDAGHAVVGLDAFLFDGCTLGPDTSSVPGRRGDIRDVNLSHVRDVDAVVHLAAISNDPVGQLSPSQTLAINHAGSVRIAQLAKRAGVQRFIFASSCSMYGAASPNDLLAEDAAFNPVTPYAQSKVLVERDVSRMADDEFSPVFLRNATVYGFSPRLRLDLVVNDFVAHAVVDGEIEIKSDGTPWRPLVHVNDVATAILAALEAPRDVIHNEAFNIGRTNANYRISEVADIVQDAVRDSRITYASDGGPDARCYRADFSKAEEGLPGFRPRWDLLEGVKELAAAFQRHGLGPADLTSSRFIRLRRIQELLQQGRLSPELRWLETAAPAVAGT